MYIGGILVYSELSCGEEVVLFDLWMLPREVICLLGEKYVDNSCFGYLDLKDKA